MNRMLTFLCLSGLLSYPTTTRGFIFDEKQDCEVSPWGHWGAPDVNGEMTRNRDVMRNPINGGLLCPADMSDTKYTGTPSLTVTSTSVVNNFMRPRGVALPGQSVSKGQWRDLLLIVDSSGSVGQDNFNKAKYALARLLNIMCPTPDPFSAGRNQAALIEYSSRVGLVFNFDKYNSTHALQAAILSAPFRTGTTCTASVFRQSINMFTSRHGARITEPDVKKEILILTDGDSNCGGNAYNEAMNLQKYADVYGLVIGQPSSKGKAELESYVTGPLNKHMFAVKDYQDLDKLISMVETQVASHKIQCAPFDVHK